MTCNSPRGHWTVLIVDDDPNVTVTFARMLRLGGFKVLTALDVETGLVELENHPDAVLLDLRMPFVDGLAFLRVMRAQEGERHTPVAIITGDYFLDEPLCHELRELDAAVYFKPLWFEDLIAITQRMLLLSD
jgi:DNA-binding response OmpR family regulator